MPATQRDIAREVGVSQTVVSDVLHGRARGRVSPETRERIFEAARRLQYQPNASAQALRSRQSRQVAYATVQPELAGYNTLGEQVIGGLAGGLVEREYRLVLDVTATHEAQVAALREMIGRGVCDACVARATEGPETLWRELKELGQPVVVVGQCDDPELTSVAHDAPGVIRAAMEHLAGRGHQRVGLITHRSRGDYYRLIHSAWSEAAPQLGLDPERYLAEARERPDGQRVMAEWLRRPDPPTAVISLAGRASLGACQTLLRNGVSLLEEFDLALIGNAGDTWQFEPGTWYFGTDLAAIGRRTAEELLRMLDGQPGSGPVRILPELQRVS